MEADKPWWCTTSHRIPEVHAGRGMYLASISKQMRPLCIASPLRLHGAHAKAKYTGAAERSKQQTPRGVGRV